MRVPLDWLHEYCRPALDAHALAERLAMTGTEVERVERHGVGALERFVVGKVLEAGRHPDADRLTVCKVDLGDPEPAQIVCGAPNVAAGQTVAVARPGALMPDGTKLHAAKLRGVVSDGMILAEDELAIGTEHDGILLLDRDGLQPGTPLEQVLPIATEVLVLEVTSNRPDCLGIYGVAREVHAATGEPLAEPPWTADPGAPGEVEHVRIEVKCPELCPRFTARVYEDVQIGPSPPWLKARLMAAGQRPISNVVDISNYVMLLTGQPVHAFDLDRVAGSRLTVRRARDGETVETLDGQTRRLDSRMVVIDDEQGPTSIAGVMGGARSEVTPTTTRVLLEAATWIGANIHRTALKLGLRTEASSRFEKQLQPEQAMEAQALAGQLLIDLCGALVLRGTVDLGGPGPAPPTIRLRDARIESLLGVPVPRERSREILSALEFDVADAPDGLDCKPPAFRRADVTREADVIEEVARLNGLENLPATLPSRHGAAGRLTAVQRLRRRASDLLAAQGLHEIVGWSFTGPAAPDRLRLSESAAVVLANPMSAEQSRLRTTLLVSLLDVAAQNRARGAHRIRLFEAGPVYLPRAERQLPDEPYHLGALTIGPVRPGTWRDPEPRAADFYAAKGVLQGVLDALRADWQLRPTQNYGFLHPGRGAEIVVAGKQAGWLGEIHPDVAAEWELSGAVSAFEFDLDAMPEPPIALYTDVTSFPEVREDLAVVVAEQTSAAQLLDTIRRAGGPLLADADVFDVYRDPQRLGEGMVSLAVRLHYRAPDRTLTDEEVAARRTAIVQALAQELGARIRA
jgi:phenylalanyl-tRNA synthetase beta chain